MHYRGASEGDKADVITGGARLNHYQPQIVVRAPDMLIAVERLTSKPAYPEELADKLKTQFPGEHVLKANVLGVDVVTTRQGTGT